MKVILLISSIGFCFIFFENLIEYHIYIYVAGIFTTLLCLKFSNKVSFYLSFFIFFFWSWIISWYLIDVYNEYSYIVEYFK